MDIHEVSLSAKEGRQTYFVPEKDELLKYVDVFIENRSSTKRAQLLQKIFFKPGDEKAGMAS